MITPTSEVQCNTGLGFVSLGFKTPPGEDSWRCIQLPSSDLTRSIKQGTEERIFHLKASFLQPLRPHTFIITPRTAANGH